ncbi:hypothetical protein J7I84_14670 [Arthrobacter sp. ISL-85]|uniref:GDSL-type esterase/lipase family protein n=1 Tax=Arthrobacter sp. ISL-85 TaxID=2819115 RepID=UPI001BECF067|nr:GDSL-type esterase/lipase family protein [Arthrobacter sp. ISL-85]MBT2567720.1 hypothetical protein [Arthrobacter sp. ISL-85]
MVDYTYSRVAALNFNTTPATVAKSATGKVYAIGDTTFTTPLNITLVVGGLTTTSLSADANGFFPDFTVANRTSVVWKQGSSSFTSVLTTTDPVPGPKGDPGNSGAKGDKGDRGDLATWQPNTFYPLNQVISNQSGDLVKVTTAHTSGASYDSSKFDYVVPPSLTPAALSATYAPASLTPVIESLVARVKSTVPAKSRPRMILMGDSITDQTSLLGGEVDPGGSTATVRRFDMIGYYTWAQMTLNQAVVCQREAGITGQSTTSMLARFATDVENVPAEFLILFGGINDIGSDLTTPESIFGNLRTMCERAIASGKRVILCTLLRNEWDGTNGKEDKRPKLLAINEYIRAYCKQQVDVYLCDWRAAVIDTATGDWKPGMYFDTTHPNPVGASYLGAELAKVIKPLIVAADTDAISSNTDARNITLNPLMSGTAGVRGAGSGTIADSWNGTQGQTGGGTSFTGTMVWSKVARTVGGAWQQVQLTSAGGAWMYQRIQASALGAAGSGLVEQTGAGVWQFKPGTTIRADIEWERDADWSGVTLLKGGLHYEGNGNTGYAEDNANANITPTPTEALFPMSGMLRTPTMTIPSTGVTAILVDVRFSANAGTLRVGRMGSVVVGTVPTKTSYTLGVEDYTSRYLAASIRSNDTVTVWKDIGATANDLTRDAASASTATIQALTESNNRFVRLRSTSGDVSMSDAGTHTTMVTLAAMVRLDALTSTDLMTFAKFNGASAVRLHATGSRMYSLGGAGGFISGGGMPGWAFICMDVTAPSWRIDGSPYTTVSGTWDRLSNLNKLLFQALYTENAVTAERSVDIREAVIYDRALTTTEKTTIRTSMLARYV